MTTSTSSNDMIRIIKTNSIFEVRDMLNSAKFIDAGLGLTERRHMQLGNPGDVSWEPNAECVVFADCVQEGPFPVLSFFVAMFNDHPIVGYTVKNNDYCTCALPLEGTAAENAHTLLGY